jgi:uncharacterized protein (DUF4415 family)
MKIDFDPVKSEQNTRLRSLSFDRAGDFEGRLSSMKNRLPLTNEEGEVRELTREDFKHARPAREALPEILGPELAAELMKRKPGQRGVQKMPTKEPVTVRYSRDVLEYFRSTGPGWQTRIDAALREWVAQHGQGSERKEM